ncbi:MAG: sensor domain-containing diguanylate cyclase [Gammaproteobacteria bacterium]|nr:sensor domain-containing diguanylate cyclase [Gammaproteobacteria bacterium]MBQ0775560.1 sensor domain-containing diguanylate cyclase [Gammaproteobacteria bacterium]
MKTPDIPEFEEARLETLRSLGILDSAPEERFDRFARMAKRLFDVPIALVSIVDENRQWFKSCFGLDVRETSRDISFCGHAILGKEVFVVPDTLSDERFADNPLVLSDPHIRFYAGCPLRAPNGHALGTLCIIDQKPRSFDREDMSALADLASMIEREVAAVQMATLDELTKISNRRGFVMLAQSSLGIITRQKIPAALVFIDLDKFKLINDNFGHAEGDLALNAFAGIIKDACRDSDIFARMGGDEFAILLTNSSQEQAEEVVERICRALDKYNQDVDRGYDVSLSYGIASFDAEKHDSIEALLAEGDSLMYKFKRNLE